MDGVQEIITAITGLLVAFLGGLAGLVIALKSLVVAWRRGDGNKPRK